MLYLAATATHTAATQSHHTSASGVLFLLGLGWVVGYLLLCWIWPFTNCRHCSGLGKRHAAIGRGFRHCPRCDGSGYKVRPGRHVVNHLRSAHRKGTK